MAWEVKLASPDGGAPLAARGVYVRQFLEESRRRLRGGHRYAISVTGRDSTGLLAATCGALRPLDDQARRLDCNIEASASASLLGTGSVNLVISSTAHLVAAQLEALLHDRITNTLGADSATDFDDGFMVRVREIHPIDNFVLFANKDLYELRADVEDDVGLLAFLTAVARYHGVPIPYVHAMSRRMATSPDRFGIRVGLALPRHRTGDVVESMRAMINKHPRFADAKTWRLGHEIVSGAMSPFRQGGQRGEYYVETLGVASIGLVAAVTESLASGSDLNIDACSMAVLEGRSVLSLVVSPTMPTHDDLTHDIETRIRPTCERLGLNRIVRRLPPEEPMSRDGGPTWFFYGFLEERPGVLFRVTQTIADLRLNTVRALSRVIYDPPQCAVLVEFDAPETDDAKDEVERTLRELALETGMTDFELRDQEPAVPFWSELLWSTKDADRRGRDRAPLGL